MIHNSRDQLEHIPEFESGETFISPKAPCSENNRQELHADFRMQRGADGLKTPLTRMTDGIDQAQDLNTLSLAQARFALKVSRSLTHLVASIKIDREACAVSPG